MQNTMPDMTFEVAPAISYDISMSECMAIIKKAIDDQANSNEGIQKALVAASAVAFNVQYHKKNVQPFTLIVEGLRGTDRQTIIKWIEGHAPAIWREGADGKKRFQFNNSFSGVFDFNVLWSEKWYDLVPPAKKLVSTIDFREQLDNLVKRLERELKAEGEKKKAVTNPEVLGELKALQGKLSQAATQ